MIEYMLDTNICVYTIKNRPSPIRDKFVQHLGRVCVSSIVASELYYGAAKSGVPKHRQDVESFLARLPVLEFGEEAAEQAGLIRADLASKGTPVGTYDLLIAAHARALGMTVVTNNMKEFSRVVDLKTENWIDRLWSDGRRMF